ncbi:MAG TPA: MFS transporter [Aurantimonas coralicida]|uniref:MFS transporter n=2 Tax=root TaxID=1 RepID=A0A9C9NH60_9HYPH|nr:MFS transporter [Aurantimonas coralicida]HEU01168.1 MFS transporter [Aurantimonas coralicida]
MTFLSFIGRNGRWLGGGFLLCFFSSFGQTFFIALSNGEIRREFDLTNGEFGLIYMMATLGSAATLPFLGRLLDRFRTWHVAVGTISGLAVATLFLSWSSSVPFLLLSIYLLRLFGQGMMSQTAFTATGRWFVANRGRAISLVTPGFQAGEALLPLLFVMSAGMIGWRGAWVTSAIVLLLVALPAITLLTNRERDPLSLEPAGAPQSDVPNWTVAQVLRSPTFYLLAMGVVAPSFIGTTLFFHQVYLTELRGWPLELFASGFAVMSATTVVFALVCGWLIDRYSAVLLLPFFLIPMTFATLVAANFTAEASIFVFMMFLGISNGFAATLFGALWPEIYGVRHLGAVRSLVLAVMVFGSALGPGLSGILMDLGVPYPLLINLMAVFCAAITLVLTDVSRRLRRLPATSGFSRAER